MSIVYLIFTLFLGFSIATIRRLLLVRKIIKGIDITANRDIVFAKIEELEKLNYLI
jgi:hypothetical protein